MSLLLCTTSDCLCMFTSGKCCGADFVWCPLDQGEWVSTIVEDLTLHCFSTSTKNLEHAMQVSGWGYYARNVCTHAHTRTRKSVYHVDMHAFEIISSSSVCRNDMCPYCALPLQVHAVCLLSIYPLTRQPLCMHTCRNAQREINFISCLLLCPYCPPPFIGAQQGCDCPRAASTPHPPGLLWGEHCRN